MRVLELVYSLGAGGIESFLVNFLEKLPPGHNLTIDVGVIRPQDAVQFYDNRVLAAGARIVPVGDFDHGKLHKYISCRKQFKELFQLGHYDIIHIHSGQIDKLLDVINAAHFSKAKVYVHSHNQGISASVKWYRLRIMLQSYYRWKLDRLPVRKCACSAAAAGWSFSRRANENGEVSIINNGIEAVRYRYNELIRSQKRKELGLENAFVIGHVGRFNYQKNHDFLLDIFSKVAERSQQAKLLLVGNGETMDAMKAKAAGLGLADRVIFYGVSDDVPGMLQAMDVFVFPSHFEGLPVVGVEVQAASLMTVASDTITSEVAITDYWNVMSLQDSADAWGDKILSFENGYQRKDTSGAIAAAGYDMAAISVDILRMYNEDRA